VHLLWPLSLYGVGHAAVPWLRLILLRLGLRLGFRPIGSQTKSQQIEHFFVAYLVEQNV